MQYGFHEVFWISAPLSHYFINQFSTVAWSRFGRLINISSNRDEKLPPTPPPSSRLPRFLNKIFFGKIAAIKKKIIFNFIFQTSSDVLSKMSKGSLNIPFPVLNGKKKRKKQRGRSWASYHRSGSSFVLIERDETSAISLIREQRVSFKSGEEWRRKGVIKLEGSVRSPFERCISFW